MKISRPQLFGRLILSLLAAAHLLFRREFAHLSLGRLLNLPALRYAYLTEVCLLLLTPLALLVARRTRPRVPGLYPALALLAWDALHIAAALFDGRDPYLIARQAAFAGYVLFYLLTVVFWSAGRCPPIAGDPAATTSFSKDEPRGDDQPRSLAARTATWFVVVAFICGVLDATGVYSFWKNSPYGQETLPLGILACALAAITGLPRRLREKLAGKEDSRRGGRGGRGGRRLFLEFAWRATALAGLLFLGARQALRLQSVVPLSLLAAVLFLLFFAAALRLFAGQKTTLRRVLLVAALFVAALGGGLLLRQRQKNAAVTTGVGAGAESGTEIEYRSWKPSNYVRLFKVYYAAGQPTAPKKLRVSNRPPYLPVTNDAEFYRVQAVYDAAADSVAVRNDMWRLLVWRRMFLDWKNGRSLSGVGVGRKWTYPALYKSKFHYGDDRLGLDPHNSYLHFLYRFGLLGLALFTAVVFLALREAWRALRCSAKGFPVLEGCLAYFGYTAAFASVTVALEGPSYALPFWMSLGLTAAFAARRNAAAPPPSVAEKPAARAAGA